MKIMKTMKLNLIIPLFLFLFSSCDEQPYYHTIVEGKVINYGSKEPIDSVLVNLRDGVASGDAWVNLGSNGGTSSNKSNSVYTNKLGEFKVELSGQHQPILTLGKKNYYFHVLSPGAIKGYVDGSFYNEILEMKAKAYFNPIFKAKNEGATSDTLILEILSHNRSSRDIALGNRYGITGRGKTFNGLGPFRYSDNYQYTSVGDTYLPFRLTTKQQGVSKIKLDSIFIKSLERFKDTIFY